LSNDLLVLFEYQSFSYRTEKILHDLGLEVDFMPTPKHYGKLCANSLRIRGTDKENLEKILQENKINYASVHLYLASKLTSSFFAEECQGETKEVFAKIKEDFPLQEKDLEILFALNDEESKQFYHLAGEVRNKTLGKNINAGVYLVLHNALEWEQLKKKVAVFLAQGVHFWLLKLEAGLDKEELATFLHLFSGQALVAVTGENELFGYYKELKKAGITSIFKGLNALQSKELLVDEKMILREIIFLWQEGKDGLLGLSPILPIFTSQQQNKIAKKITALLRVAFRDENLPAFNCASSISLEEQIDLLQAGANLILLKMENLEAEWASLEKEMGRKGYKIAWA